MKKLIGIVIVIIVLIVFIGFFWIKSFVNSDPSEIVYSYEERWGISMPLPNKVTELWTEPFAARGDGAWVKCLDFTNQNTSFTQNMIKVTETNQKEARQYVSKFISNSINSYSDDNKVKIQNVFQDININVDIGDYYYYKNRGNDYFICLYKVNEQVVYTFEWHQ
ncbi:hypothetical protein LSPCS325_40910 [Lysinibacillus sp. CTST325]